MYLKSRVCIINKCLYLLYEWFVSMFLLILGSEVAFYIQIVLVFLAQIQTKWNGLFLFTCHTSLYNWQDNVNDPEWNQKNGGSDSCIVRTSKFSTNFNSSDQEEKNAQTCKAAENNHTETKWSCWNKISLIHKRYHFTITVSNHFTSIYSIWARVFACFHQGSINPWHAKTQEYIHWVWPSNVTNSCISFFILFCSSHTGKGIW